VTPMLYAVGAGPGDPQLMTLRGLRAIQAADVVFLPATRNGASYARSIVEEYLDESRQEIVELICPAYRDSNAIRSRWFELAGTVCDRLANEKTGAFVCEGDPSLYSTWLHLRAALKALGATMTIQTIAGVSSISAAAAAAGFPLALGSDRVLISPETLVAGSLDGLLQQAETLALMKQGGDLTVLADELESLGSAIRASVVRRTGRPDELILNDSASMRSAGADYFTTVLISRCNE
jgi:precorrin-2/cobalt-factor-2 C20-methyltransferase